MHRLRKILILIMVCMLSCIQSNGQSLSYNKSVLIQAEFQNNPTAIQLNWNQDFTSQEYKIYKRLFGEKEWGNVIATLPNNSSSFYDILVQENLVYEYKIEKETNFGTAYGYICSSINFQGFEYKGKMLCFIDTTLVNNLHDELNQFRRDLALNGWNSQFIPTSPTSSHFEIKEQIQANIQDPAKDMIFLLGNIAVPYSGNINPDGIPQHKGAWPCDGYYGELDGLWTDGVVYNILNDERNHNIPADGKFDQAEFPSDVEIPVGRIDYHNLTESESEYIEWTAAYLKKLHDYKSGDYYPNKGCVIQDELFGYTEAYAQNAWKNAAPIVGSANIEEGNYRNSLLENSYFISHANGLGSFNECQNVISTQQLKQDSLNSVISILYGSYFGDWDSPDNLLMATTLRGNSLVSLWVGRPNWQIHSMALGYPIGQSLVNTQNNNSLNYNSGIASKGVHISLLGDPSLEAFPASAIDAVEVNYINGTATLEWSPINENNLLAYHIYELVDYSLIPIATLGPNTLSHTINCLEYNTPKTYVLRASFVQETFSGSFINYTMGKSIELLNTEVDWFVNAAFEFSQSNGIIDFSNLSENADAFEWYVNGELQSTESIFSYNGTLNTSIDVDLIALNECEQDTFSQTILVSSLNIDQSSPEWVLYPNPVAGQFFIKNINKEGFFRVFGPTGKLVLEKYTQSKELTISTVDFQVGVYIIQFECSDGIQFQKFIVI